MTQNHFSFDDTPIADPHADERRFLADLERVTDVPPQQFLVQSGHVFAKRIFQDMALAHRATIMVDGFIDEGCVAELVNRAWLDAETAVIEHGLVPTPYAIQRRGPGVEGGTGWVIRHNALRADLPRRYKSYREAQHDLVALLNGEILSGRGNIIIGGQPMNRDAPLDPETLPTRPARPVGFRDEGMSKLKLADMPSDPGMAIIDDENFATLRGLERENRRFWHQAEMPTPTLARTMRARLADLPFATLNETDAPIEDQLMPCLARLRVCYPELASLNVTTLYLYYDSYRREAKYEIDWQDVSRDDDFLAFLVGHLAGQSAYLDRTLRTGQACVLLMAYGVSFEEAKDQARDAECYDRALDLMLCEVTACWGSDS